MATKESLHRFGRAECYRVLPSLWPPSGSTISGNGVAAALRWPHVDPFRRSTLARRFSLRFTEFLPSFFLMFWRSLTPMETATNDLETCPVLINLERQRGFVDESMAWRRRDANEMQMRCQFGRQASLGLMPLGRNPCKGSAPCRSSPERR